MKKPFDWDSDITSGLQFEVHYKLKVAIFCLPGAPLCLTRNLLKKMLVIQDRVVAKCFMQNTNRISNSILPKGDMGYRAMKTP